MTYADWYVLLDPLQIQSYVFATNKLSIIVGSSLALARWQEQCKEMIGPPTSESEWFTAGGGNVLARFDSHDKAEKFIADALRAAPPGLEVAWSLIAGKGNDVQTYAALQEDIARYKAGDREADDYRPAPVVPSQVIGCRHCGEHPKDNKGQVDGKDICAACRNLYEEGVSLHSSHSGSTPMELLYRRASQAGYPGLFPKELEDLATPGGGQNQSEQDTEDKELLAVVVMDVNNLGRKVEREVSNGGFAGLRIFSENLEKTLDKIFQDLTLMVAKLPEGWGEKASLGGNFVRLRPLFLGGDDMVLALPAAIWPKFVAQALKDLEAAGFPACAGVVVAKHNFPVNRLVQMAEELVASAKRLVRFKGEEVSALDWHVHQEAAFTSPLAARRRHFLRRVSPTQQEYELATRRPYLLDDFNNIIEQTKNFKWANRKLFALYKALRGGCQATREALVYTFLRDENKELDKYSFLWDLVEQGAGTYPLWNDDSIDTSASLRHTQVTDILELKFLRPDEEAKP